MKRRDLINQIEQNGCFIHPPAGMTGVRIQRLASVSRFPATVRSKNLAHTYPQEIERLTSTGAHYGLAGSLKLNSTV